MLTNYRAWYTTRERVKRASDTVTGVRFNADIDAQIESASRAVDALLNRRVLPWTEELPFSYPQKDGRPGVLYLGDLDLLSVSQLTRDDDTETAIASTDYFLEPADIGPPYFWIEIDKTTSAYFAGLNTSQRAVRVTGDWGYSNRTRSAGTVASGLADSDSATSMVVSNGALVDVGNLLLCQNERLFVTAKSAADTLANLSANADADTADETITVNDLSLVHVDEIITVDSERMLVYDKAAASGAGNLFCKRAWDGTNLASHSSGADVYAQRTCTVERGVNGSTAATHSNGTPLTAYDPPADIQQLCLAYVLNHFAQNQARWQGGIGSGDAVIEATGKALGKLESAVARAHKRKYAGAV